MSIDNIPGRLAATVCALALGAGGTSLLFGDVIFNGCTAVDQATAAAQALQGQCVPFTQKHFQTICIVLATTMAWMAMTHHGKNRNWIAALGFLVLAASGSLVIVWNSLGRQTEGQMMSEAVHNKAVGEEADLKTQIVAERTKVAEKRQAADDACKNRKPEHNKCAGPRATQKVYENSLAGLEARLKVLAPPKPADANAEALGKLADEIGKDGKKAKALSLLVMPYFITVLFEFGFTLALHAVFAPSRRRKATKAKVEPDRPALPAPTTLGAVTDAELSELREAFVTPDRPDIAGDRKNPGGGTRTVRPKPDRPSSGGRLNKQETLQYVLTELALRRTIPSQDALAGLSRRPKQTVSDWLRDWERDKLIPARTQAGRCKSLTATT